MRSFTVAELIVKLRERADLVGSRHITDLFITDCLSSARAEVYDLLVTAWDDYFTILSDNIPLVNGQATYDPPEDFYKLTGVDFSSDAGTTWERMRLWNMSQRNQRSSYYTGSIPDYRLMGDQIMLVPAPTSGHIRLWYIPAAEKLTADDQVVDGVNGWEELVLLFAMRRVLVKDEDSTTGVDSEIARQMQRLQDASIRDAGEPVSLEGYHAGNARWGRGFRW